MTETDLQPFELLIHALKKEVSEHNELSEHAGRALKQRARYKYFELHICHDCLHCCVVDWTVLGFASDKYKKCELCGLEHQPLFELLFVKTTRKRKLTSQLLKEGGYGGEES
jgi:hypothetical protein